MRTRQFPTQRTPTTNQHKNQGNQKSQNQDRHHTDNKTNPGTPPTKKKQKPTNNNNELNMQQPIMGFKKDLKKYCIINNHGNPHNRYRLKAIP